MKHIRRHIIVAAFFMLTILRADIIVSAAEPTWVRIYQNLLEKGTYTVTNNNYSWNASLSSFLILDIDQNGTPELVTKNVRPESSMANMLFFTVKKGKLVYLDSHGSKGLGSIRYCKADKGIYDYWWTNGIGGSGAGIYSFDSKGMLTLKRYAYTCSESMTSSKILYSIEKAGNWTTKARYDSYVKTYFASGRFKTYKFYENTAANRKKVLKVSANDLSKATVSLPYSACSYTGKAGKPVPVVKLSGKTLKKDMDYTVSYSSNVNAGMAKVTVTGKGKYTGKKTVSFTIRPKSITNASVKQSADSFWFDGTIRLPYFTITLDSKKLKEGTDYKVYPSFADEPGRAIVNLVGTGNYTGTITRYFTNKLKTPTVTASSKEHAKITVSCGAVKGATGYIFSCRKKDSKDETRKKTTKTTAAYEGLVPGAEYYVTVKAYCVNGQKATVYSETSKTKKIKVYKGKNLADGKGKLTFTKSSVTYTYNTKAQKPEVKVKYGLFTLKKNTDYTVDYSNCINAGTATVKVTGKGEYYGSLELNYKINQAVLEKSDLSFPVSYTPGFDGAAAPVSYGETQAETKPLSCSDYVFRATPRTPSFIVSKFGKTLKPDADYTTNGYNNNINVGTASVKITGKGNYKGTVTRTFEIKPLDIKYCEVTLPGGDSWRIKDGKAEPPVKVVDRWSGTLIPFDNRLNYRIDYANNTEQGMATVTVTGLKNLTGSVTLEFMARKDPVSFNQTDSRWRDVPYGYSNTGRTIPAFIGKGASGNVGSGCGVLSLTNAVYYLTGHFIEPKTIAEYSLKNGHRVHGVGTAFSLYKAFADDHGAEYGFSFVHEAHGWSELKNDLQAGCVSICSKEGHIMAIVDYDPENDTYLLLDSCPSENRGTKEKGYIWERQDYLQSTVGIKSTFYVLK